MSQDRSKALLSERHVIPAQPAIRGRFFRLDSLAMAAACLASICSFEASAAADDPAGLWLTKGGGSIIKIAPCGKFMCGSLVWLKEPLDGAGKPKTDHLNEDAAKRGRAMIGIGILLDLEAEKGHWRGKAYNPKDGKTYDITFKASAEKAEVEGCVMKVLCATDTFVRTQSVPKTATP
jgi:uncharacterized protein (DUF2147 family)